MYNLIDGISGSTIETTTAWIGTPDAFDLAAEREAQALAYLTENTPRRIGRPSATPLHCADAAIAAIDADGKVVRIHRTARKLAVKRWIELTKLVRIATDLNAGDEARARAWARIRHIRRWNPNTTLDRQRRAQRRQRRAKLLAELQRVHSQWIPFGVALKLAEMGERTLYRATMEGRVRKSTAGNRIVVSTEDLRAYLKLKVAA